MLKSHSILNPFGCCLLFLLILAPRCAAAQDAGKPNPPKDAGKDDTKLAEPVFPKDSTTQGSVSVAGHAINYQAVAGTILVAASNDADAEPGFVCAAAQRNPGRPAHSAHVLRGLFQERRSRRNRGP